MLLCRVVQRLGAVEAGRAVCIDYTENRYLNDIISVLRKARVRGASKSQRLFQKRKVSDFQPRRSNDLSLDKRNKLSP